MEKAIFRKKNGRYPDWFTHILDVPKYVYDFNEENDRIKYLKNVAKYTKDEWNDPIRIEKDDDGSLRYIFTEGWGGGWKFGGNDYLDIFFVSYHNDSMIEQPK